MAEQRVTSRIVHLAGVPGALHLMRFRCQTHLDHLVRSAEERLGLPITDRPSFVA